MKDMAPQWLSLFDEYEAGSTPEAVFVKQLDKLDMGLQAKVYQQEQGIDLDEFITSAKQRISESALSSYLD